MTRALFSIMTAKLMKFIFDYGRYTYPLLHTPTCTTWWKLPHVTYIFLHHLELAARYDHVIDLGKVLWPSCNQCTDTSHKYHKIK